MGLLIIIAATVIIALLLCSAFAKTGWEHSQIAQVLILVVAAVAVAFEAGLL